MQTTYQKKWGLRRQMFKDKVILHKESPRKGICHSCYRIIGGDFGRGFGFGFGVSPHVIKRTSIHHIKYHKEDPLKDTVELCNSCHSKIIWIEDKKNALALKLNIARKWVYNRWTGELIPRKPDPCIEKQFSRSDK